MTKKSLILGAAITAALASGPVLADLTGNAAISSNYIWRGITQTSDQAAGSGGIDWSDASGVYAGTWVSNVQYPDQETAAPFEANLNSGYEMDLYAGFAGEAGDFGYDVGVISYQYPVTPNSNFTEVYLTGSFEMIGFGAYFTVDKGADITDPTGDDDLYLTVSADINDVNVYVGSYMFDAAVASGDDDPDYIHYGASFSKDDFTFAVDKNDIDEPGSGASDNNVRFTVSWGKEFAL